MKDKRVPDGSIMWLVTKPAWCITLSTFSLHQYSPRSHFLNGRAHWWNNGLIIPGHRASGPGLGGAQRHYSQRLLSVAGPAVVPSAAAACPPAATEECIQCFLVPVFADYRHNLRAGGSVLRALRHPAAR